MMILPSYPSTIQMCIRDRDSAIGRISFGRDSGTCATHSTSSFSVILQASASPIQMCIRDRSLSEYLAPAFYITSPIDDISHNRIYINDAKNDTDIYYFTTLAHEGYPLSLIHI